MLKILPKQCDICKNRIGLYQPFYTLQSEGRCIGLKRPKETAVLCPTCFHCYKDFLNSREEFFIYQKAKQI